MLLIVFEGRPSSMQAISNLDKMVSESLQDDVGDDDYLSDGEEGELMVCDVS